MSKSEVVVVIPAYNPDAVLVELVTDLTDNAKFEVLVVNDGSDDSSSNVFKKLSNIRGCRIVIHEFNQGKGAALKTGMREAISATETQWVITADADGQHLVKDIEKIAAEARANDTSNEIAILGVRNFSGDSVPLRSRFGNKLTSSLVQFLFGNKISDTQTGLRAFSRNTASRLLEIPGQKYEFELNCLITLIKSEVLIKQVEISTVYIGTNNDTSHFKPFRDSTRIYLSLIRNFLKFSSSSLFSSGIDLAIYALIINSAFGGRPDPIGIVVSVVVARIVSSIVNLATNRYLVFRHKPISKRATVRYYLLAVGLMASSAAGSALVANLLDGHVVWAKVIVDVTLFIVSYLAQGRWVFAK